MQISFIPENMKMSSVESRVGLLMETDWKAKAADLLAERKENGGEVSTSSRFLCRAII